MFDRREEAGNVLAERLNVYSNQPDCVVFGIPRGGIVVAAAIAQTLHLPIFALIVKKLESPGNPELAIGAISMGGVQYVDAALALRVGVSQEYLDTEIEKKKQEVKAAERLLRVKGLGIRVQKKTIILVDDGIATGATAFAAIKYIKKLNPNPYPLSPKIILAVPVIAKDIRNELQSEVDEIVALEVPEQFGSVGQFYSEFPQVSNEEVVQIMNQSTC